MKFLFACAVLAVALVYCAEAQHHNQEWGKHEEGDKRIYSKVFSKSGSFLQVKKETMQYYGSPTITYIQVTDQYSDGKGGYATIVKGGPGHGKVEIEFKSQRGKGYNFIVEIWGK